MDRAHRLIALAAGAAVACGPPSHGRPLPAGQAARSAPTGLRVRSSLSNGVLAYGVAVDVARNRVVSVELATAFELVVRSLDRRGRVTATARTRLGPADWDIADLALSRSGRTAWIASADGTVRAIDIDARRTTATWHVGAPATAVAVSRDDRYVATGSRDGVMCLRRATDGALLQCVVAHPGPVSSIDFSNDRLATVSWSGDVSVWQLPSLATVETRHVDGSANAVAFSPDGRSLAIATSARPPVRTPEIERAERRRGFPAVDPRAVVVLWKNQAWLECRGHRGPVSAVAWSPDGGAVISGSWDRTVRLWDAGSGRERERIDGFGHIVRDVATTRGGGWAAAAAWAVDARAPSSLVLDLLYTE